MNARAVSLNVGVQARQLCTTQLVPVTWRPFSRLEPIIVGLQRSTLSYTIKPYKGTLSRYLNVSHCNYYAIQYHAHITEQKSIKLILLAQMHITWKIILLVPIHKTFMHMRDCNYLYNYAFLT